MTTTQAGSCDLPLLVVGLPAGVRECLRAGGVPFAPVDGDGLARGRRKHRWQPRFALYDSRDAGSRRDVEGLRRKNLVPVDVAACLARSVEHDGPEIESPSADARKLLRSRLWQSLKQAVEEAGGLWARVPEAPFPWQYDPPLWHPAPAELKAWRRIRSRIQVEVARTRDAYQIAATGEFGGFRPAIELWRGRHVASFELQPGTTTLPLGGLVYQQRSDRSADPVPSGRADDSHITVNPGWIKPQSA